MNPGQILTIVRVVQCDQISVRTIKISFRLVIYITVLSFDYIVSKYPQKGKITSWYCPPLPSRYWNETKKTYDPHKSEVYLAKKWCSIKQA